MEHLHGMCLFASIASKRKTLVNCGEEVSRAMGFLDLFVVALMPVLKVLLVTAVGLFLAFDSIDLLGAQARHHLNNIVFFVFSPAMVGSYLAETITLTTLAEMWFMPVNILLTFIIGSALGWILVKIAKTPPHLQGLVIGSCAAGNLGNLLLIIIPAVCTESNSPFGDSTVCTTYGTAYASASMAIGAVYIWSYVFIIMRVSANKSIKEINANDSTISINSCGETSEIFSESCTESLLPSKDFPSSEDYLNQAELPHTTSDEGKAKVPFLEKIKQHVKIFTRKINLKMLLAPSTIGAIVGFIIGIVSPIRKAMIG
ncbi:hypothetical protein L1049_024966 [Liquidambar formosana]|uniref:PIN-like protein n=1 Tax=Liquidambar formosana TaxID=63359 RepID=A0AAP0S1H0_LIQFO